eukprot:3608399-Rhodomonas_salina.1
MARSASHAGEAATGHLVCEEHPYTAFVQRAHQATPTFSAASRAPSEQLFAPFQQPPTALTA